MEEEQTFPTQAKVVVRRGAKGYCPEPKASALEQHPFDGAGGDAKLQRKLYRHQVAMRWNYIHR